MRSRTRAAWLAFSCTALALIPLTAWAFYKPVRLLAPPLAGMSRASGAVYTDAPEHAEEAKALYDEAIEHVTSELGPLARRPHVVFCSSEATARSLGLDRSTAKTFGPIGTVFGPRAWKPYYVRHELIHQVQYERLGAWRALHSPNWFMEGMAYSLSEDPRHPLTEPFESYRVKFDEWYRSIDRSALWKEAP